MAEQDFISDKGIGSRRTRIIANGFEWFTAMGLQPDPRYPPIGIVRIDEIYGKGPTPRRLWFDYFEPHVTDLIGPNTRYTHNWIGSGTFCAGLGGAPVLLHLSGSPSIPSYHMCLT